jgi:hypothetical protein
LKNNWDEILIQQPVFKAAIQPGLPDGIFSNRKSKFGLIFEGLAIEDVGTFLCPFATFQGR